MKQVLGFVFLCLVISCANNSMEKANIKSDTSEMLEYEMNAIDFTLEDLVSEKLLDYFELLKLQKEHPEFKDAIDLNVHNYLKKEFIKLDTSNFMIKNIRNVGEVIIISDSVQSQKLYFDIVFEDKTITDSIQALIFSNTLILYGTEVKTTKVTFTSTN